MNESLFALFLSLLLNLIFFFTFSLSIESNLVLSVLGESLRRRTRTTKRLNHEIIDSIVLGWFVFVHLIVCLLLFCAWQSSSIHLPEPSAFLSFSFSFFLIPSSKILYFSYLLILPLSLSLVLFLLLSTRDYYTLSR